MNWHLLCLKFFICHFLVAAESHRRLKRFLLFPRQSPTRHQFIAGVGIPADLTYESLTIGHVLKAEFFLPYNVTVFQENPFWPEYQTSNAHLENSSLIRMLQEPTKLRWHIYEFLENQLESYGFKGRECLLKAICEANSLQFVRHFSVVAEILHILLRPTSTLNAPLDGAREYLEAQKVGDISKNCEIYDCYMNLLNLISDVLHL